MKIALPLIGRKPKKPHRRVSAFDLLLRGMDTALKGTAWGAELPFLFSCFWSPPRGGKG